MSTPAPKKTPFVVQEKKGEVWICNCGKSKNQPYCDGSHAGSGITPRQVQIEGDKTVAWCACRQSKNFPYCDGSHNKV